MIWGFVQFIFWMWVWAICGGVTLCVGVLIDMKVDNVGQTVCVLLLWPIYAAIMIVHAVVWCWLTLFMATRKKAKRNA